MTLLTAAEIWRNYVTAGVPGSGVNQPSKPEIRAWGTWVESMLGGGAAGLAYETLASLNADLAHGQNSLAMVWGDATGADNGMYSKVGLSGFGSWTRIGDLPNSVIRLTVTGGTGNAIVATAPETPTVPGAKLYLLTPGAQNTDATTINVNGNGAVAIKNSFGAALASGSLLADSQVVMAWAVDHYQLLISANVDASAFVTDAQAARVGAEAAFADTIAAASSTTALFAFPTKAAATSFATPSYVPFLYTDGRISAGKGRGYWAPTAGNVLPAHGEYVLTNGRYFEPSCDGAIFMSQFGTDPSFSADNNAAFQRALAFAQNKGISQMYLGPGEFKLATVLPDITQGLNLLGSGRGSLGNIGVTAIVRTYNETDSTRGILNFVGIQNIRVSDMNIIASGSTGGAAITLKSTSSVAIGYSTFDSLYCSADIGSGNFDNTFCFIGDAHASGDRSNFMTNCQLFGASQNALYLSSAIHFMMFGGGTFAAGGIGTNVGNFTIAGGIGGGSHPPSEDVKLVMEQLGGALSFSNCQYCKVEVTQIVGDIVNTNTVNNTDVRGRFRAGLGYVCQANWDVPTCSFMP
jgi:hypothetical protein